VHLAPASAGCGETVCVAVLLHCAALVGSQSQVRARLSGAYEREASLLVLWVVAPRVAVVPGAAENLYGAGEVPALLAG
jgi:hypothetical protein